MVVVSVINFKQLTYDDYVFPPWANWVGWGIALSSMTLVPAYIAYKFLSTRGSLWEVSSAQGERVGQSGRGPLGHCCQGERGHGTGTPGSDAPTVNLDFHICNLGTITQTLKERERFAHGRYSTRYGTPCRMSQAP